jgi:hypothetical protein
MVHELKKILLKEDEKITDEYIFNVFKSHVLDYSKKQENGKFFVRSNDVNSFV